jgi:general secretion pathway protein G
MIESAKKITLHDVTFTIKYANCVTVKKILTIRKERTMWLSVAQRRHIQHGFTLLELLVVVAIIGLLAGYVGPKYFGQLGKAEIKATRAQINALGKALDQYRLDIGHYPNTQQGLNALITKPGGEPKWAGPYLTKEVPLDPWSKPYVYKSPGEHGDFDLISYGRDGRPGGSGEDADIVSW